MVLLFNIYSQVVGPRRPLKKDPELDYEVDSDEEWEEVVLIDFNTPLGNHYALTTQELDRRSLVKWCFLFCLKEQAGESLSDCENDEEESLEEGCSKADDEDDSEDDFMVPDGYLSEDEVSKALFINSSKS